MNKAELKKYFMSLGFSWGYQSQAVFGLLMEASDFCKGGVILDAGAARQRYKPFFEESDYLTQEHLPGIELKDMQNINYNFISPIDKKIPLKDNSLDGILSTSVIEHLRYPDRFILEAYRILKPGGKLFINVPFVMPEHEIPFDFNRPTSFGLKRWFDDAGFEATIKPSSSCTETICAMMTTAFRKDILKSNKCCRQIFDELIETKEYGKLILKLPAFFFVRLNRILCRCFCVVIKSFLDRGPRDDTHFPVGWIAVATKPKEQ